MEVSGGVRYLAKTDGARNPLYERLFVTVSPTYEETLPTIANPPSLRQKEGGEVLWTVTAPESWTDDHKQARRIASYGIDKSNAASPRSDLARRGRQHHHAPASRAAEGRRRQTEVVRGGAERLGWLQGVYSNYTDFATVSSNWNPDYVRASQDGEWRRAWPRNYCAQTLAKSVEIDEFYAQRIKRTLAIKMSYTDVHSASGRGVRRLRCARSRCRTWRPPSTLTANCC